MYRLLRSVNVISENKTLIARINSIKLLTSGFLDIFGSCHNFQVVANSHFVPPAVTYEHRGMPTHWNNAPALTTYFHLSSNSNPAMGRNEDISTGAQPALHFGVGTFHKISFDDVIVLVQPWYNVFPNGHRSSSLSKISENENFSVLIKMQTERSG